ncbi:MAG: phosphatidate cytidylyltransferase [Rhodospirillales bacterium]|nr:phosphatidate cytidylyltransferase [Rhodospirillales bacterium]
MVLTRCLSAVVLAVPVLAAVHFGSPFFEILVVIAGTAVAAEWCRMCSVRDRLAWTAGLGGTIAAAVVAEAWAGWPAAIAVIVAATLAIHVLVMQGDRRGQRDRRGWISAGVTYIGLPSLAIVWLRGDEVGGRDIVLWLLLVVWASDIGAYAAGRTIGGPRLAPRLSPNKTWAGLAGALAAAAAAGAGTAVALGATDVWQVMLISAALGGVAQGGDLLESGIKRRFGVKDTGAWIPGHGGLLDRVDGLMAASVALALIVATGNGSVRPWI